MTVAEPNSIASNVRLRLAVRGAVQGVGFRPFVYRLANELGLTGWVNNSPQGVFLEVEGARTTLEYFRSHLDTEKPPRSFVQSCEASWLDAAGYDGFVIRDSETAGGKTALVLPDIATCPDCLREIFDPTNRRHLYPFTNCTNCGPRFSIIEALPYDRANTSMRGFRMCPACQAEYDDPGDRRFHAQPNACPVCGPQLELWPGRTGAAPVSDLMNGDRRDACTTSRNAPRRLAHGNNALLAAAHVIRCGQIVAVKGIGGFHLFVDARNEEAVRRLRERKHREEKPFALMFPSLASVNEACDISPLEERLLQSPEAPIVLLPRLRIPCSTLRADIAPGNPNLGVMLPSNPLHHLLMAKLGFPVIATSGNLGDEPICTDEFEALERLRGIADVFLIHNRPIVRHVDDSIVRVMLDREMVLRRARGYAPLPVQTRNTERGTRNILAVGAHLKNSVALAVDDQVFISQHIGDLETEQANHAFRRVAAELPRLYDVEPEVITADLHPDYLSTQYALERRTPGRRVGVHALACSGDKLKLELQPRHAGTTLGAPHVILVQHHIAHVLSCIAENEVELPALGVAWDGTGLGTDGTIWGGEFFRVTNDTVERVAHWCPFRLPGGDAAAKEPRRAALGLLHELASAQDNFMLHMQHDVVRSSSPAELTALKTMVTRGVNAPWCCSVGRLFDAVAALVGLRQQTHFEGQAAMELEFAIGDVVTDATYEVVIADRQTLTAKGGSPMLMLDWARLIEGILANVAHGVTVGEISARFHNTLAEAIVSVAKRIGCVRVALSGGCFQNRYLTERAVTRLRAEGFQPYWHQRVPTNDGGIALGQIVAARRELAARSAPFTALQQTKIETLSIPDDSPQITLTRAEARAPLAPARAEPVSRNTHHASR
jgi:hydrogenase maturation protein HypF